MGDFEDHDYALRPEPIHPPEDLPLLDEVLKAPIKTIQHIPKAARGEWAKVLADVLFGVLDNIDSERHWWLLLSLPKCVLFSAKRGGKQHQRQLCTTIKD